MSAFDNYTALQNAVKGWLFDRDDLDDRIPEFIALAEAEMNRRLRVWQMVVRSRIEADSRYIPVPANWRNAWNVQRVDDDKPLEYKSPVELDRWRQQENTGVNEPIYYTLFGFVLELAPSPTPDNTTEIEMIYFASVPTLSADNPSNRILLTYPDLYLYGALKHTAPFLLDDERLSVWDNLFETALATANAEAEASRRSGAPMRREIKGFN